MALSTRALVSLSEAKDWLQVAQVDTANDAELERVIDDISDRIHQEAEREFKAYGTNPATRTFVIDKPPRLLPVGDLAAYTQIQIIGTDWATVVETVAPAKILPLPTVRQPWEPITHLEFYSDVATLYAGMRVTVQGTWGFPAVPGDIRQACLDAVAAVMDRDVEHYSQDLGTPAAAEGGTVVMVGGSQRILSLPPVVLAACWRYRLPTVG